MLSFTAPRILRAQGSMVSAEPCMNNAEGLQEVSEHWITSRARFSGCDVKVDGTKKKHGMVFQMGNGLKNPEGFLELKVVRPQNCGDTTDRKKFQSNLVQT